MVLLEIVCRKCGEKSMEAHTSNAYPDVCSTCKDKEEIETKLTYLRTLKNLSVNKRLAKIEEYIYEDSRRYKQ